MIKRVSMVKLRSDMPLAEAQRFWVESHASQVATALADQGLRRYVVNLVDVEGSLAARHPLTPPGLDAYRLGCDGFAETWYDSVEAMERIIGANSQVTRGDEPEFIEEVRVLVVDEHPVI